MTSEFLIHTLLISFCQSFILNTFHVMVQEGMILSPLYDYLDSIFRNKSIKSKWRNSEGLLYIAKPIYACVSCMPSLWSLPLLIFLPLYQVILVSLLSVSIATIINRKIFD